MTVVNPKSISGINSITTGSGSDNLLTIHTSDENNTERVRVNSSGDVIVGSGVTLSPDGDAFFTGVTTTGSLVSNGAVSGTTGTFTGDVTVSSANLTLGDSNGSNNIIVLGASNDLQISHVSNVSKIRGVTTNNIHVESAADFKIKHTDTDGSNAEDMIVCTGDGAVDLYNDNTKRIATTGNGADVFGSGASSAYLKLINTSASSNNSHQFTIDGYNSANTYWNKIKIDGSEVHLNTYTGNRATLTNTALTFASGVNIAMADGQGIDFSATGTDGSNTSSESELFNDYEKGSCTILIQDATGSNISVTSGSHNYTKIGNRVFVEGQFTFAESGSKNGGARISKIVVSGSKHCGIWI